MTRTAERFEDGSGSGDARGRQQAPGRRDETAGQIADEARAAAADARRMAIPRTARQKPVRAQVTGVQAGGNDEVEPAAAKEDRQTPNTPHRTENTGKHELGRGRLEHERDRK